MTTRAAVALLVTALLVGCAGSKAMQEAPEREDRAVPVEASQDQEPLAPSDPWARVPGGAAGAPPAAAAVVRFREPADPRPVAAERRPVLPGGVILGVVAVQDGRLAPEGDLLLRLDAELSREEELDAVVGPGGAPDPPEVDLAGLAAICAAGERHLLLVDVRPSRRAGAWRDGYLLHAATGALLAAWSVGPEGLPAPTGRAPDLVQRIAAAHARLRDAQ